MRSPTGVVKGYRKSFRGARELRPTTSLVKAAIFNMLPPEAIEGARVLDAFAGTGALGLEALERGAAAVDFIERDPELCRRIRSQAPAEAQERAHVYCATVQKALGFLTGPYDLALMDPPYELPGIGDIMTRVATTGLMKDQGLMVVEHASRAPLPDRVGPLVVERRRRYGDTAVSFYRKGRAA